MKKGRFIILASRSPWRKRLLKKHGILCRIHTSAYIEKKSHLSPRQLVLENAKGKAMAVWNEERSKYRVSSIRCKVSNRPLIILGVDTVGVLGKKILGKPNGRKDAERMLRSLRGKRHRVITGLCVIDAGRKKTWKRVCTTYVVFRKFSDAELQKYLDSNHWKGKAGSYAIQGRAKGFVERIEGDVTNVVGLPMKVLLGILGKFDV